MTVIVKYHHNQTALLPDDMAFQCAVAQIIHTHPIGGHWKFLWERGVLKANILEAKYEAKLEFPWGGGGGGVGEDAKQNTFRGGSMDIFWNSTM